MPIPITTNRKPLAPRILLYGVGGIGKTTLAASIPDGAIMPLEDGLDALPNATCTPKPGTWAEALAIIESLTADPQGLRALAIDSVSALQELCYKDVCVAEDVASIEALGYGKGYVLAAERWRGMLERLTALRARMAVLLIGHSAVSRHEDPRLPGYDRLTPRLQSNGKGGGILPMTVEWADVVCCAAYDVVTDTEKNGLKERTRALGEGERILYCQERPAYLAKSRYPLPPEMPFTWQALAEGIRASFRPTAAPAAAA
jgi:hypothetical protein